MPAEAPPIPLARWADRQLRVLAKVTGSQRIAAIDGATITGERGSANGFIVSGRVSAGPGGGRIVPTRDQGWFALTVLRQEDRAYLPALFLDGDLDFADDAAIAAAALLHDCGELVARGRDLGLPVASANEVPASAPVEVLTRGPHRRRDPGQRPLVIDLSAIWAGPLVGHFLWLAGAEVIKVEGRNRPDLIRRDDPATFSMINQGKANVALELTDASDRSALIALIRRADFVIESSRPRALRQLGIDADALVREIPGLVWLSVTGHGASRAPANWAGIGHDCGVAAGLSRAMADAGGEIGFVGDALPDPLTGIVGAVEGWRAYLSGEAQRIGFAMSAIAARALAEERAHDPALLPAELLAWSGAVGLPFARLPPRPLQAETRAFGADTARILADIGPC